MPYRSSEKISRLRTLYRWKEINFGGELRVEGNPSNADHVPGWKGDRILTSPVLDDFNNTIPLQEKEYLPNRLEDGAIIKTLSGSRYLLKGKFEKTDADPRAFAIEAHKDQKYGEYGYSVHLDAVADYVRCVDNSWSAMAVAYLHDVVEDTDVSISDIENSFGKLVARAVNHITDPAGKNRKERKKLLHKKLQSLDSYLFDHRLALIVKAADRLANLSFSVANKNKSLLKMYRKEHEDFRKAVYRPGLCDKIWSEIEQIVRRK